MDTRSRTKQVKLEEQLQSSNVGHFGLDVSGFVHSAMQQGGSLDELSRRKMKGDISRNKLFGGSLQAVVGQGFSDLLVQHRKSGNTVAQLDNRIDARKGGAYKGFMFSSTRVLDSKFDPQLKEIGEPLSPNPYSGTGESHRAHTTPFALGGIETNDTRTVNAFSWANVTVDSFIEGKSRNAVAKYGEGNVFHFRFDTSDRSTVGYVVDRGEDMDQQRWKRVAVQYERK